MICLCSTSRLAIHPVRSSGEFHRLGDFLKRTLEGETAKTNPAIHWQNQAIEARRQLRDWNINHGVK